jgi:hypothetical protein
MRCSWNGRGQPLASSASPAPSETGSTFSTSSRGAPFLAYFSWYPAGACGSTSPLGGQGPKFRVERGARSQHPTAPLTFR